MPTTSPVSLAVCALLFKKKCSSTLGKKKTGADNKPSSVPCCYAGQWSFISNACCQAPLATYPKASGGATCEAGCCFSLSYLVLLRVGFAELSRSPGILVSSYLTFSPLPPLFAVAVYFLWHFPWGRPQSPLATTLPCGARTFLCAFQETQRPFCLLRNKINICPAYSFVNKSTRINYSFCRGYYLLCWLFLTVMGVIQKAK